MCSINYVTYYSLVKDVIGGYFHPVSLIYRILPFETTWFICAYSLVPACFPLFLKVVSIQKKMVEYPSPPKQKANYNLYDLFIFLCISF